MKRFVPVLLSLLCAVGARAVTSGEVLISPESRGVRIDKFFKDYKSSGNPNPSDASLDDLFIADGLNGIRTPIYGNLGKPAHPSSGTVVGSYYTGHVNTILRAKQRNPDLIVFASKKLEGQDSFPAWTKDASGVLVEPYAEMLADYIEYMAAQGITVDVLGIDNERRYNEGNITPQVHRDVVDALKALSVARGFAMPLIIGHEDFDPDRNNWMSTLMGSGWGDRLDIFGTHYYPRSRPLTKLQSDLAWAGTREKWHTELHWDSRDPDDMLEAEQAVCAMWDCTDNGMNGLMWWGYSRTGFRGSLMRQFSVPLVNAWALTVDDPDGANISANGKLQTRAFLQGNQLTVYAVNVGTGTDWSNLVFRIDSGYIVGPVSALQWTSTNQTSGAASSVTPLESRAFAFTVPDRSLSSFTFTYAPSELFAHYPFDGSAADVSSNGFQGLEVGSVAYPPGREGQALSGQVGIPSATFTDFLAVFQLKTSAADGPLLAGGNLSLAVVNSNAVFTIGTNTITSFKPLNDGRWHQIAAERSAAGGEMRLYIDGRPEAYADGAADPLSGADLTVGGISGLIDNLKMYDRPFSAADRDRYSAPSVLLTAAGDAEERGPATGAVTLSSAPAGADYPYLDLVEDDGTWLQGYSGSTLRNMGVGNASNPVLLPNMGKTFFTRTSDAWWRGVCKPQLDGLTLEAGTYTLSFYVGDADTNYLFYAVHTDPVAGNNVGLTATDPSNPVLPDMGTTVNSLIHKLDTNIVAAFETAAVPGDGEWVQWRITYSVPTNSPILGRPLGFLFRKPARNSTYETRSTGAFDGPFVLDFTPAQPAAEPPLQLAYSLQGSTAAAGTDTQALPPLLTEGTNAVVPVADLVAEGPEQLLFSLAASSNYYIAGGATASVAIVDHPMDGWRAVQFGTNAANPAIAGDAANPDGDRYSNEQEWLLAADPLNAADTVVQTSVSDPNFILTYTRRDPAVSGIDVHAAWTPALTSNVWKVNGDGMTEITIGQSGEVQTQAVLVPLDSPHKFIRIEVVK